MQHVLLVISIAVAVLLADRLILRMLRRRMENRQPTRKRMIWAFSVWGILLTITLVCLIVLPQDLIWYSFTPLIFAHFSWKFIMLW